jgi:hypothetical protein
MQLANWSSECPSKTATAGQNLLCAIGWGCTISSGMDLPVPEGKRPFGINRHKWEGDIKMDIQEVGWGYGLDRSGSGYGEVAGTCKRGNELSGFIKCGEFLD